MRERPSVETDTMDLYTFTEVSQRTKTYVKRCFADVNENTFSIIRLRMIKKLIMLSAIKDVGNEVLIFYESVLDEPFKRVI